MDPTKLELVIASYKENLWYLPRLESLGCKITVYNANGGNINCFKVHPVTKAAYDFEPVKTVTPVPNQAREAGQWLYHLVNRYDSLSEYTLFLQADLGQSMTCYSSADYGAAHGRLYQLLAWIDRVTPYADFMPYDSHTMHAITLNEEDRNKIVRHFEPLDPPVMSAVQPPGGQFMGSKDFFRRIPLTHYQRMLDECKVNGFFAHEAEFIWPTLLDCFGQVWPYTPTMSLRDGIDLTKTHA